MKEIADGVESRHLGAVGLVFRSNWSGRHRESFSGLHVGAYARFSGLGVVSGTRQDDIDRATAGLRLTRNYQNQRGTPRPT